MNILRAALHALLFGIPIWTLHQFLIAFPLQLIGLIAVPIGLLLPTVTRPSRKYAGRTITAFRSPLLWLFGNEEDGLAPAWYVWANKGRDTFWVRFKWLALRNPVGNLRFVPWINPKIVPSRIRFVGADREPPRGTAGWFYVWQGAYSGVRLQSRNWRIWIGWKLKPDDRNGIDPRDMRAPRCGFAFQLKRVG